MQSEHRCDAQKCFESQVTELLLSKRAYAPYFHFKGFRKEVTEMGVVSDWLMARYESPADHFVRQQSSAEDPPDILLYDKQGGLHGIEVTELVDQDAVRAWQRGNLDAVKDYSRDRLHELVLDRIRTKSIKPFRGGPFVSKRLLIYSDEQSIAFSAYTDQILRFPPFMSGLFDEAWFVIPPAINTSGAILEDSRCRIFPIPFAKGSSERPLS